MLRKTRLNWKWEHEDRQGKIDEDDLLGEIVKNATVTFSFQDSIESWISSNYIPYTSLVRNLSIRVISFLTINNLYYGTLT